MPIHHSLGFKQQTLEDVGIYIYIYTHIFVGPILIQTPENCEKKLFEGGEVSVFSFTLEYITQVKPYPPKERNPACKNRSLVNNHMPNCFFKVVFVKTTCP